MTADQALALVLARRNGVRGPLLGVCYLDLVPITEQEDASQLVLTGDFDVATAPGLRAAGARAVEKVGAGGTLSIDMAGVTFIDSSGLGALVAIHNAARSAEASVVLVAVPAPIARLLSLTGLDDTFHVEPGA